jgi:DNA helicase-2/ATP-dependent DNA helicase PcrA
MTNYQDCQDFQQEQRHAALEKIRARLRPGQQAMADWRGGRLAVSAVPGSGKSTGMAGAAAIFLGRRYLQASAGNLEDGRRQLVVVTFTRSASANIRAKIRHYLKAAMLPLRGFSVSTLHGLALTIASAHPDLSGLNLAQLTLVNPAQNNRLIRTCVEQWIVDHPSLYHALVQGCQFDGEETERLRRQSVLRTEILPDLAITAIHEAKSSGLLPADLQYWDQSTTYRAAAESSTESYAVLTIAAGLYERYQRLLQARNLLDYDDMLLAALRVLQNPAARKLWQQRTIAVFEDEAQDSTPLQTQLLEILATDPDNPAQVNWIRVGDPNQAINSTFTPADPIFFREFCAACQQHDRLVTMDQAGRSTQIIMDAANFLVVWVNQQVERRETGEALSCHPPSQRFTAFRDQRIHPVAADDPQVGANPQPLRSGLEIHLPRDIYHSATLIRQQVQYMLEDDPQLALAILVRENKQGQFLAQQLVELSDRHGIPIYEVGQRDRYSRVPGEMLALLHFVDRPHSPDYLKAALTVLVERKLIPSQDLNAIAPQPEQFLYPDPLAPELSQAGQQARQVCDRLIRARLALPSYQLILFFAMMLNYDQTELATADKLTERVTRQLAGDSSMAGMLTVLNDIVSSERFEPVETDDLEQRYTRPGQLTIITMHKAKGLDWDGVFIPFLQESMIPGSRRVPPQTKFLGDFSLAEVARAQIRDRLHHPTTEATLLSNAAAWEQAGYLKTAEEYRLLYVAMTRAKRFLWLAAEQQAPFTWNRPDNQEPQRPCPVIPALRQQFPLHAMA